MYLGTPEPVGFRVDPGFASLIFDRGLTYEGYHIFPSTICDVKSKTTEITTVDEFKKFSSERTSFNGNFAYSGVQVGGSSSNARSESIAGQKMSEKVKKVSLECTGKPYLLKAQHSAFNISDSTTIPLTVQNWQITSFVPDSTDLVVDSRNKCLAVRTIDMQRCPGFHKNVSFAK